MTPQQINPKPVDPTKKQNEIISVDVPDPIIKLANNFHQMLAEIPNINNLGNQTHQQIQKLLQDPNAKIDEDSISEQLKQIKVAKAFIKETALSRKTIKAAFDNKRDIFLNAFDKTLKANQADLLEPLNKTLTQDKKDISNHRANQRWAELKVTFDADLNAYPIINELAQPLMDFTRFRLTHPKLVSGAKNAKITDKHRSEVNKIVNDWANGLMIIKENATNLSPMYQNKLLSDFISNPQADILTQRQNFYTNLMQQEIKRKDAYEKAQMEAQRQAQLKAQQRPVIPSNQPQAQAQPSKAPQMPQQSTPINKEPTFIPQQGVQSQTPYPWLMEIIQTYSKYQNISTNPKRKLDLIADLMTSFNAKTRVYKEMKTDEGNMLNLLKYILSL